MYLKRIELRGFKSFAGSKDIELGPGVTGIVGPNGSGKSNICDAIRWVLGEQSSRTLRGSSLQDVIFKGTQSRPKRNVCEVSLVFDNTDNKLDLPYSEVSVSRSINRAGDSGFRINGTGCRLRDILTLFQNTGVGRDGYSIIGQGQISHILEHRASERRGVFDEAAGITRLRSSKEEAERNLERTHANMDRLRDIQHEILEQLEPAREQMERAKAYISLSDELQRLEVTMLLRDGEAAEERAQQLTDVLSELREEQNRHKENLARTASEAQRTSEALARERAKGRDLLDQLGRIGRENERQRGAAALAEQKIEAVSDRLRELEDEDDARAASAANLETELSSAQSLKADLESGRHTLEAKRVLLLAEEAAHNDLRGAAAGANAAALRADVDGAERASHERRVKAAACAAQKNTAAEQLAEAQTRLHELKRVLARADASWEEAEASWQKADRFREEASRRMHDAHLQREQLTGELQEAARRYAGAAAQADVLAQAQQAYDGYYEGVRALMRDAAVDETLSTLIVGVVGESIRVPDELETAMEVALGAGMQNVVVRRDADARELVRYLRRNRYGRVTFLPADALRTRYLNSKEREALHEEGCVCAANEAVECSPEMRPAVDYLLGRTVIVRDLDTALRLKAAGRNTFRVVTVQGDIVSTGGAITGGSTDKGQRSFLARRRQAEDAAAYAEKAKQEQDRLLEQDKTLEAMQDTLRSALKQAELASQSARERLETATAEKRSALSAASQSESDAERYADALAAAEHAQSEAEERAGSAERRYETLVSRLRALESDQEQQRKAEIARAGLETRIAENEAQLTGARDRLHMLEERIAQIERALNDTRSAAKKAETLKQSLLAQRAAAEQTLRDASHVVESSDENTQRLRHACEQSAESEQTLEKAVKDLEEKSSALSAKERTAAEQVLRTENELEKLGETQAQCAERLWTDYELTIANAQPLRMDDFDRRRAKARIGEIRRAISELGPVNPHASEDFRRLSGRSAQYAEQLSDLQKAGQDLELVIADLLDRMRRIFLERFSLINENFGRIFRELFGGGSAHIELTEDEEVMSAGIEILAEPPGKKLQSLSLLSGGERTLTAIALCLAMLAVNPSPVCILDEIDAPLDDKNAIRLAEYLHRVSGMLQFIIITHRKTTMAVCDAFYGVSMPDQGVSDIVSVRLD